MMRHATMFVIFGLLVLLASRGFAGDAADELVALELSGGVVGTGVVVAKDARGFELATAGHVVAACGTHCAEVGVDLVAGGRIVARARVAARAMVADGRDLARLRFDGDEAGRFASRIGDVAAIAARPEVGDSVRCEFLGSAIPDLAGRGARGSRLRELFGAIGAEGLEGDAAIRKSALALAIVYPDAHVARMAGAVEFPSALRRWLAAPASSRTVRTRRAPNGATYVTMAGVVVAADVNDFLTTCDAWQGASGGAVLDARGRLVGVISGSGDVLADAFRHLAPVGLTRNAPVADAHWKESEP